MAGQLLNRGGVLESVSNPIRTTTTEEFYYSKKGDQYLLSEKVTVTDNISLAVILVGLITAGIIVLGPKAIEKIKEASGGIDWESLPLDAPFGLLGLLSNILGDVKIK